MHIGCTYITCLCSNLQVAHECKVTQIHRTPALLASFSMSSEDLAVVKAAVSFSVSKYTLEAACLDCILSRVNHDPWRMLVTRSLIRQVVKAQTT